MRIRAWQWTALDYVLGALTAVVCSTSGVINIAIEGQLLLGAFCAAIATTVTGSLWLGLVCGAIGGCLVGALLAVGAWGAPLFRWRVSSAARGKRADRS